MSRPGGIPDLGSNERRILQAQDNAQDTDTQDAGLYRAESAITWKCVVIACCSVSP